MKVPRFRIAWVMVAVAITALDFTAIRTVLDSKSPLGGVLLLGALPMANVLVVGLVNARQRPKTRLFLVGFELFGAIALASYIALSLLFPGGPIRPYVSIVLDPILATMGPAPPFIRFPIIWCVVAVILAWPQVAFALLGGFLSRKFRVTITDGFRRCFRSEREGSHDLVRVWRLRIGLPHHRAVATPERPHLRLLLLFEWTATHASSTDRLGTPPRTAISPSIASRGNRLHPL